LQQHRRSLRWRTPLALITVLVLLASLLPMLPAQRAEAEGDITLSKSIFAIGYPGTRISLTGGNMFPFHPGTQITLYNQSGQLMNAIAEVQYEDDRHMSFTLLPGLSEGRYKLVVISYETAMADIHVMSSYDPTHVQITPGADRDIRIDWTDPSALDVRDIVVQYTPVNMSTYLYSVYVPRGQQTVTLRELEHNKAYKIKIYTRKTNGSVTAGTEYTNGGSGYVAKDTTPPGELTQLVVTSVPNGFDLRWKDPVDPDLSLITIQYAEHGTTNWSEGRVVAKGTEHVVLNEMNTSKRYDFRFTKTDILGNWSQQMATNGGYGYTYDTTPPSNVTSFTVTKESATEAVLTWQDPADAASQDFHHVNVYLKSSLTGWVLVGRVDKGVEQLSIPGLAANIDYTFKAASVDRFGNESSGVTKDKVLDTFSLTDLRNVTVTQEVEGGLKLQWSESGDPIDFKLFKVYYAPHGTEDYRETVLSNMGTRSAYLRDMPRGTYDLQFRLYDRYGVEKDFHTLTNNGFGYYVSGKSGGNAPHELGGVRIQPLNQEAMQISWNPATTDGTHVEIYVAERAISPQWRYAARVDKRDLRCELRDLLDDRDYFFKLVVVDSGKNTRSYGVIYDNSGYGYNLLGGDRHPPREVTEASASLSGSALTVSYLEPTDPDFDKVTIYAERVGTSEVKRFEVPRGQGGTTIRDLQAGAAYTLRITTVDTFGNESKGVTLNNNGRGYHIPESAGPGRDEVRNAVLIPETSKMTVRFSDPLNADYDHAIISIRGVNNGYFASKVAYKGTNEVTFDSLDRNQFYKVHIIAVTSSDKKSAGVSLGGTTGVGLQPVSKVQNARVTADQNKLVVTWEDPAGTVPTGVQVEVQVRGTSVWSEPLIVQPGTEKAVFHGLGDSQFYKVRITTLLNQTGSSPVLLDGGYSGYKPEQSGLIASPSQITYQENSTQRISLIGTNTRFTSNDNDIKAQLYSPSGQNLSSYILDQDAYSATRYDITLKRSLTPGLYKLVLYNAKDGVYSAWIKVVTKAPAVQALSLDKPSATYNYAPFTVKLTGTGFKNGAKVVIDGQTEVSATSVSSDTLSFTMPRDLLPGVHRLLVKTSEGHSNELAFTVHAFSTTVQYTPASSRNGIHKAELQIKNHDRNSRGGKVLVLIRRNGQLVETKEYEDTFKGYQTLTYNLTFGGVNSPYAEGPMNSLSIQVFVVDPYSSTPLAEPVTLYRTLNL
jgi:hypothetical protein